MKSLDFELNKKIIINLFRKKLKILQELYKNNYKSETTLLGVCYLDYLAKFFCNLKKSKEPPFCTLLNHHSNRKQIWSAFYPGLYKKYTGEIFKHNQKNDELIEFIDFKEAKEYSAKSDELWKGTLSHFLYKEIRCIAVHEKFCSQSEEIKIPVEYTRHGFFLTFKFIGDSLLNGKRPLSTQDIIDELIYFIGKLNEIPESKFTKIKFLDY